MSLISILQFREYRSFASLSRFIPRYFIFFDVMINGMFCLFSFVCLYAAQEATVRTGCGKTYWFQIGKGVRQGCILSPCLFNLYAEYIMRNTGLEEAQAGIKIAGRNINNVRYADDTTLMVSFPFLQKEMATYASILAWEIPQTKKPGRLQSIESDRT